MIFEKIQQIKTVQDFVPGNDASSALTLSFDFKYLVSSAAGDNSAVVFEIDPKTGLLTQKICLPISGEYPKGRADRLTPSQRAGIATAFCETVRSSGYQPGVYAGQNFFKAYLDYNAVSRYSIWLASYTTNNELPLFDKRYDLWQFTERGRVDGIRGIVDLNVIY